MGKTRELPIPIFFDVTNTAKPGYIPDKTALFQAAVDWRREHKIKAAGADKKIIDLLIIDAQKDFCFPPPDGALYVGGRSGTGAIDDNGRIANFIYRDIENITNIRRTFDTHFVYQIFFPTFWLDENGNHPEPNTIITGDDIRKGKYRPNPAVAAFVCGGNYGWLLKQVEFYCDELKRGGRYDLTLWPFHTMLGDEGHKSAGVIQEAVLFHDLVRGAQSYCEVKGGHSLTENYSVFRPEVLMRWDGKPLIQRSTRFLEELLKADVVIIAGQAKSHCVAWTIDDLLTEIKDRDEELVKKVYILDDCSSAVVIPGIVDYTDEAEAAFEKFADAGMHVVKSEDPIEDWPDINL